MSRDVEKLFEAICDNYCKYPDIYNEEISGEPLSESEICTNCPVIHLIGEYTEWNEKKKIYVARS